MKKDKIILTAILSLYFVNVFSQNTIDSINYALKLDDYNKALDFTNRLKNEELKFLFLKKINYYLKDNKVDTTKLYKLKIPKNQDSILFKYLIADIYHLGKSKKIEIYDSYFQVYKWHEKNKDTLSINESLKRLCDYIIYNARNDTIRLKNHVSQLDKYKKDSIVDHFWATYYKIQYNFFVKDFLFDKDSTAKSFRKAEMKLLFDQLLNQSNSNKHHRAKYYTMLGIYQGDWLGDYNESNKSFLASKSLYNDINNMQSKRSIKTLDNNLGVNYFKNKEYNKAIITFKESLKRKKKLLYKIYTNEWLYKCYDSLKQPDSALHYFKMMVKIKDELKQVENTRQTLVIEAKYDYNKIVDNLENEIQEKRELKSTLFTIVPILGLITLILIFIFYLYKRYKKKSAVLEEEQSETLLKLDELKNIVIKNHIVLKDKTKIYISGLLYIKSDDHYLNVYTTDGKNHMVRGKLSQIKEELPPNFTQNHRSYIINSNFIHKTNLSAGFIILSHLDKKTGKEIKIEIPLSRSNKKKF